MCTLDQKKKRIVQYFPFLQHTDKEYIRRILATRFVDNDKYRALPRYKIHRLYDLVCFVVMDKIPQGKLLLDKAKKVFPELIHSIGNNEHVTCHLINSVFVEGEYAE